MEAKRKAKLLAKGSESASAGFTAFLKGKNKV